MRLRAALLRTAAMLLVVAGCSGTVRVPWKITFDSSAVGARTVRVLATMHDGADCSGSVRYAVSIPHGVGAMTVPPAVPEGTYTVCAEAIDDACEVFATGHTTVDLRGTPSPVVVLIVETSVTAGCPGSACSHGDCVPLDAAVPDGGPAPDAGPADAGAPDDAAPDAADLGTDAGCATTVIPAPTAPQCDSWTGTCIYDCGGDTTCADGCVAADSNPTACGACLDAAYDACGNVFGCQAVADAFACCSHGCADPTAASCCPTEGAAWDACLTMVEPSCGNSDLVCYH